MSLSRKRFLKYTGLSGAVLATGGLGAFLSACGQTTISGNNPVSIANSQIASLDPTKIANFTTPINLPGTQGALAILEPAGSPINLSTKNASLELLKGKPAPLLVYQAENDGKNFINPIIKLKKGDIFTANLTNDLTEATTIHWHGLSLDWKMDGHPSLPVNSGATFQYRFTVQDRGGTYWYHPHPHKTTARQAYSGLASFFIVEDDDNLKLSQALDLKLGETDLPLVIQDKIFDNEGKLVYQLDRDNQFMGFLGDSILVNLTPNPMLEVNTRIYRLRLLNGSNARTYRLAFIRNKTNQPLPYYIIGTDGGLLDRPYQTTEVFISPGERIDTLIDLKNLELGEVVALKSLAFDPMHTEMGNMGGMNIATAAITPNSMPGMSMGNGSMNGIASMNNAKLADGQEFFVLKLVVKNKVSYDKTIPESLSIIKPLDVSSAKVRPLVLSQAMMSGSNGMMQWLINAKTFNMDEFPITVKKGSVEIWEFRNEKLSMPHPMHLHGFQFQVLERLNSPAPLKPLAIYSKGRVVTDLGWKDTMLVWPGETVRVAINFSHNFEGEQVFLTHCHVLEHEDNGMMLNVKVTQA